ncbi:MAG: hypothetical protein GC152_08685 [Alphaproteobacteria bacterium]|nr:hypothetical protein [Alphaproteobacteria bacterium]
MPYIALANKDWVLKETIDTEKRIEKAFHDQTQFLSRETKEIRDDIAVQTRWMFGLFVTMTVAILVAVLFG